MLSFQICFLKSWKTAEIGRDVEDTLKSPWQRGTVRDGQHTDWGKGHHIALSRLGKLVMCYLSGILPASPVYTGQDRKSWPQRI